MTGITPSQTVGPYFKYGLTPGSEYAWNDAFSNDRVTPDVLGERIRIEGRVFDGDDKIVPDSMLEIWQADSQGRFSDPQDKRALPNAAFCGFGRCGTDNEGKYSFETIKPGSVLAPDGKPQASHILLAVYARGMTRQAQTRIYFSDEIANASDPIRSLHWCRQTVAKRWWRRGPTAHRAQYTISTFICRAPGKPCSLIFEIDP